MADTILPLARLAAAVARTAYEAERASLADVTDARRALLSAERLAKTLRASREKSLLDLESLAARPLAALPAPWPRPGPRAAARRTRQRTRRRAAVTPCPAE